MAVRTSRLDQMEEYIRKHDFVPLDDLCVAFQRSKITIRRDLSMLEENFSSNSPMPSASVWDPALSPPLSRRCRRW